MQDPPSNSDVELTLLSECHWSVRLLALVVVCAFLGSFGYLALLCCLIGCCMVAAYWPAVLACLAVGAVLKALVSRNQSDAFKSGLRAGLWCAFAALLVALTVVGFLEVLGRS